VAAEILALVRLARLREYSERILVASVLNSASEIKPRFLLSVRLEIPRVLASVRFLIAMVIAFCCSDIACWVSVLSCELLSVCLL
jgi:hypothetical protein